MDIFSNTTDSDSTDLLEIDRFKAKILEIWSRMLTECYSHYYDEDDEDLYDTGKDYCDITGINFTFFPN